MSVRENMPFRKALKKTARWFCYCFTVASLAVMLTPLPNWLASHLVVDEGQPVRTDLIAVLGGGAYANGVLGGASNERLIKGVVLYREGRAPKLIFTGGSVLGVGAKLGHTVLGVDSASSSRFAEAVLMREAAVRMGLPERDCLVEANSLSTFENLVNLKAYMDRQGLKRVTLVSSPLHMKRVELAAGRLGMDCYLSPAPDATMHKTTPIARVHLMRDVLWEYAALGLYWVRGQV